MTDNEKSILSGSIIDFLFMLFYLFDFLRKNQLEIKKDKILPTHILGVQTSEKDKELS